MVRFVIISVVVVFRYCAFVLWMVIFMIFMTFTHAVNVSEQTSN